MTLHQLLKDSDFPIEKLTEIANSIPAIPTRLGNDNLFDVRSVYDTIVKAKYLDNFLIPLQARGSCDYKIENKNEKIISLSARPLFIEKFVDYSEIANLNYPANQEKNEAIEYFMGNKIKSMRAEMDIEIEYLRTNALKGFILDANDKKVDFYEKFAVKRQRIGFDLEDDFNSSNLLQKTEKIKSLIDQKIGPRSCSAIVAQCGEKWFDKFIQHPQIQEAWEKQQYLSPQADCGGENFYFNGIFFQLYYGRRNGEAFIPENKAFAYPKGVQGMFQIVYANGVPYDTSLSTEDGNTKLRMVSHPVVFNTLPDAVIELTTGSEEDCDE